MANGQTCNRTACTACDQPPQTRLNYFTGQFLAERDLTTEQAYQIGKHRQHNTRLHGWGTVCGLRVVQHPAPECRDRFVVIEPGLALDCCGRELVVCEPVYVDLAKLLAPTAGQGGGDETPQHLLLSLCYNECPTEFVPALFSECGCDENGCQASRVQESYTVEVQRVSQLPEPQRFEPVGVSLHWSTTIGLERAARLALDTLNERLFVLTSADPGQVMVYNADNHALRRTLDVEGQGVELALSPTGQFLYLVRHVAGTPGDYFLRVLDLQDLDNPVVVNDLPLAAGPLTSAPQLAVAPLDGRVYVLDLNASPKQVLIWKTSINTSGTDPSLPPSDPNSPLYATLNTGSDPRALALSPDGAWLFIAEATDAPTHVTAARVDTLTTTNPTLHTIEVAEKPMLLGVSSKDSVRLFVVTEALTVRAFAIQETPTPFPELGGGISVGPDQPVGIVGSPAGKWAYLLVQDANAKGWVRVLDAGKLETDPTHVVSEPVAVVSGPRDILLAPDGRRLYVAGEGAGEDTALGISVLDVSEEPCGEIFWRALEGCPPCPEDPCVLLAAIPNHSDGMVITDREIDNRIRPLAPSTDVLRQVILCMLESGIGKQGPEGPQGQPGQPGAPGADGATWFNGTGTPNNALGTNGDYYLDTANGDVYQKTGGAWGLIGNLKGPQGDRGPVGSAWLNGSGAPNNALGADGDYYLDTVTGDVYRKSGGSWTNVGNIKGPKGDPGTGGQAGELGLTQIVALSWRHNTGGNPLVLVTRLDGHEFLGLVIAFAPNKVIVADVNDPFNPPNQIDAQHVFQVLLPNRVGSQDLRLICRCAVDGMILPVEPEFDPADPHHIVSAKEVPSVEAPAAAFVFNPELVERIQRANELWVVLRGDLVLDTEGRAIDAEFVRAEFADGTGDRPKGSDRGIQGGLFESWFWIGDRPKPTVF